MITVYGLAGGIVMASTANVIASDTNLPWWAIMLIGIIPPIVGAILDLLKAFIVKHGWLDKTTADKDTEAIKDKLENTANDLLDDGKLNGSNKGAKENDDNKPAGKN